MIANLAWKNIWRNKVRSGVILGAIALGLFGGTYLSAFMSGWMMGRVDGDIDTYLSHIQIHDKAFPANGDISAFFMKDTVTESISGLEVGTSVSCRLKLAGMLASASNALGVTAKGVDVKDECDVSIVWKHIPDSMGVFLSNDVRMPIVISKKVAEKLKVRLKSKIVFTFQDAEGEMQSLAFRVCGIYKTTNGMFDEGNVFVRYGDLIASTGLPDGAAHEAGIKIADPEALETVALSLKNHFSGLSVQDWKELDPTLSMSMAFTDMWALIIIGIFLFALSFGIINTMLMAVLERTRELGMLGAIGMSKSSIFRMIMLETLFLTLLGSMVGMALGAIIIVPSIESGINLSFMMEDQFEDFGYSSIIYPVLNVRMFVEIILLVIVAGILSAIYPAGKALKLKPLEAIRH